MRNRDVVFTMWAAKRGCELQWKSDRSSIAQTAYTMMLPSHKGVFLQRSVHRGRLVVRAGGKVYADPVHKEIAAFAPATVANLGPGFDWMGCAVGVGTS